MKRIIILLLIFLPLLLSAEENVITDEPEHELFIGAGGVFPPPYFGVNAQYYFFPIKIEAANGYHTMIGAGAQVGYYLLDMIRICVMAEARFQLAREFYLDVDAGLGFFAAAGGVAFMGTIDLAVPFKLNDKLRLRPYIGVDFAGNPNPGIFDDHNANIIIWPHIGVLVVLDAAKLFFKQ